jgi:hypothetical protein
MKVMADKNLFAPQFYLVKFNNGRAAIAGSNPFGARLQGSR